MKTTCHTAYGFAHWFGLTPKASAVLAELYAAQGKPLTAAELARRTRSEEGSVVRTHLYALRYTLVDEAIDHVCPAGYALSEAGLAECRNALRTMGEELLAA